MKEKERKKQTENQDRDNSFMETGALRSEKTAKQDGMRNMDLLLREALTPVLDDAAAEELLQRAGAAARRKAGDVESKTSFEAGKDAESKTSFGTGKNAKSKTSFEAGREIEGRAGVKARTGWGKFGGFGKLVPALAAALLLLCGSATVFAAIRYFSANEVAEKIRDYRLAEALEYGNAVQVNETQRIAGYDVTLLGLVSGENITQLTKLKEKDASEDRMYAVVAVAKTDGTPLTEQVENGEPVKWYKKFFVSPLLQGSDPGECNVYWLHGSAVYVLMDGVLYCVVDCDNVEMQEGYGKYLCVTEDDWDLKHAYDYDEATGIITRAKGYAGVNALFALPVSEYRDVVKQGGNRPAEDASAQDYVLHDIIPSDVTPQYVTYSGSRYYLTDVTTEGGDDGLLVARPLQTAESGISASPTPVPEKMDTDTVDAVNVSPETTRYYEAGDVIYKVVSFAEWVDTEEMEKLSGALPGNWSEMLSGELTDTLSEPLPDGCRVRTLRCWHSYKKMDGDKEETIATLTADYTLRYEAEGNRVSLVQRVLRCEAADGYTAEAVYGKTDDLNGSACYTIGDNIRIGNGETKVRFEVNFVASPSYCGW